MDLSERHFDPDGHQIDQRLKPALVGGDPVRVPGFNCSLDAGDLRRGEFKLPWRQRERGVQH
jgi:hypothetical protein